MNGDSEDFSSSYEPSKAAKWFHNRKRWDEDFHSVSNTFPDDHDKDEWGMHAFHLCWQRIAGISSCHI